MKRKHNEFPKDWQIILFAAIMFLLAMQSCTTTKDVLQVKSTAQSELKKTEETQTNTQAETNTNTKTISETETTEQCDSLVDLWVQVPGKIGMNTDTFYTKVSVPVKFNRTTKRKEFTQQDQQKKESGTTAVAKKEQLKSKSDSSVKDKTVERTGMPWWTIGIITLILLAGVAVLLWRLKVF